MTINTYDLKSSIVTINGVPITGFGDGDVIDIEYAEEQFKLHVGATGETSRSRINNSSGKSMLKIKQSSLANSSLQTLFDADLLSGTGTFIFILTSPDGYKFVCNDSFITKHPKHSYGKEEKDRDWEIAHPKIVSSALQVLDTFGV